MADRITNPLNAYESTLSAEMSSVASSMTISDVTGLDDPFYLVIEPDSPTQREYVYVSVLTGSVATVPERYLTGSAAGSGLTHLTGSVVRMVANSQIIADLNDRIDAVTSDHGALTGLLDDDHTMYLLDKTSGGVAAEVPTHNHSAAAEAGLVSFVGVRAGRVTTEFQIASGSFAAVEWNAETFDSNAFHDNSTNPTRLTVPAGLAGKYAVHGLLLMPGAAIGSGGASRQIRIRKNGTTNMASSIIPIEAADASIVSMGIELYSLVDLAATDYVELMGLQDTGGTVDVTADDTAGAFFEMHLVGV